LTFKIIKDKIIKKILKPKKSEEQKMAESLVRVHTHTHTQGNLVNEKQTSIKSALLNVQIKDR